MASRLVGSTPHRWASLAVITAVLTVGGATAWAQEPPPGADRNGPPVAADDRALPDTRQAEVPPAELLSGALHAVVPFRILDTRQGLGVRPGPLVAGESVDLPVAGVGSVPASGVVGVVLNVTVTEPTANSFVTVWPAGSSRPEASTINMVPGQDVPNLVEVALGTDGRVSLFNYDGSTHLIADVMGWVGGTEATPDEGRFRALSPSRVLDTRNGTGTSGPAALAAGQSLTFAVAGRGGVPATGVSAVVLNLTAAEATEQTFITAWPTDAAMPNASNLNVGAGPAVANRAIVRLAADGTVTLFNYAGSVHLIVDVGGWFTAAGSGDIGAGFTGQVPARVLDTRSGLGAPAAAAVGPGGTLTLQIAGRAGVPAITSTVPPSAVVANITVTEPTEPSFLTAWPSGVAQPLASDLNFVAGTNRPNFAIVKLGPDGAINLFNFAGSAHVIVDVLGWYSGDTVLAPGTVTLGGSTAGLVTAVTPDTVTFSTAPDGLTVGGFIVSGVSAAAPAGFLRRVVTIEPDPSGVLVRTAPAAIDEVVQYGALSGAVPVGDTVPGTQTKQASATFGYSQTLEGSAGGGSATATVSGSATVTANPLFVDVDIDKKFGIIPVGIKGKIASAYSAGYELSAQASGSYDIFNREYGLYEHSFAPITITVGVLPVVIIPEIEADLVVSGKVEAAVGATVSETWSLEAGVRLDGGVDPYLEQSTTGRQVEVTPPQATATLNATLNVVLDFAFYGTLEVGVGIGVGLEARVATLSCSFTLDLVLTVPTEFEVEFLGKDLLETGKVFELARVELAQVTLPSCAPDKWTFTSENAMAYAERLAGSGVTVVGAQFNGSGGAAATYTAPDDAIFSDSGVVLSSGSAFGAAGPNSSSGWGTGLGSPGSSVLSAISGYPTFDAATLTIQFVPSSSTITLDYQFGSDEYTEYVGTQFNDVMAALVNGSNCAVIARGFSTYPVTINLINDVVNAPDFINNESGALNVQADGLTRSQQCVAPVTPGGLNTIQLTIADSGDSILDSWAFFRTDGLRS